MSYDLDVIDRVPVVSYIKHFPSMHSHFSLMLIQNYSRAIAKDDPDMTLPP